MKSQLRPHLLLPAVIAIVVSVVCALIFARVNDCSSPIFWTAAGHSMEPTLRPGDREIAAFESFESLRPGRIVIFRPEGGWTTSHFVCHRIITGFGGRWVTRGDNNDRDDPGYVTRDNYIATVSLILHQP